MNEIVGWIVGNTQSGPHSFRKKKPHCWQYSDGLVTQSYHEAEVARLRAEVEGLRNALEKIASIRLNDHASIDAAYGHACSIANEAIFDHSDAAMGASA